MEAIHELPEALPLDRPLTQILNGDIIGFRGIQDDSLNFFRLPPATCGGPVGRWSVPPFPFRLEAFAVYTPDSVLAIAEGGVQ